MMLLVRAFGEGGALEVAQGMIDNAHAALSTARTDPGKRPN
jgi:hypothetical protein